MMFFLSTNKMKVNTNNAEIGTIIPNHIEWIKEQISTGNVLQAGKWGATGGMCVIAAENIGEAEELLKDDPLIQSGLVTYELNEFYPDVPIN